MMHRKSAVICVALMCVASSEKVNTTAPKVNASAPAHPGFLQFLGNTLSESMRAADSHGTTVYTATGRMVFQRQAPAYLLAAYEGLMQFQSPRPNGASKAEVTWIGFNNAAKLHVDRYLIVKQLTEDGRMISDRCFVYPEDIDPSAGITDPLQILVANYQLTQANEMQARYDYDANWGRGDGLHSRLMTGAYGFPPTMAHMETHGYDARGYFISHYDFQYGQPEELPQNDVGVFYKFQNYQCEQVETFKGMPEACLDSWLAVEYECANTPAAALKKEAKDVIV